MATKLSDKPNTVKTAPGDLEKRFRVRWNADHPQVTPDHEFETVVQFLNWISAQYSHAGQRSPWCFAQVFTYNPDNLEGWEYCGTVEMTQKLLRRQYPELHKKHFKMGHGGSSGPDAIPDAHFKRGNPERR